MGQVQGKVAIVTGGASRIGAACAATLAREDEKVVVTDLDEQRVRRLSTIFAVSAPIPSSSLKT